MVTVQPVDWALDETVFDVIEPLWDWLLENRAGILAVEGGHFFDRDRELK